MATATGNAFVDPNAILGSQPQIDDSVANQVTALASKDSALNQMARTEGLKAANRRGLLNSSMAVNASQDAVLQNVLPIASQDAAQAFQKNQAAKQFEYGMAGQVQQQGWQTGENTAQREFLGAQAGLDRALQSDMQLRQIASTEGMQEADIQFRMKEGALDRAAAVAAQERDIAWKTSEAKLDRSLQEQIAKWNLSSNDRNAAAQMLTNMETMYQNAYSSIMANTNLDAATRNAYLAAAQNMRNSQINFVEQVYNVDLHW